MWSAIACHCLALTSQPVRQLAALLGAEALRPLATASATTVTVEQEEASPPALTVKNAFGHWLRASA